LLHLHLCLQKMLSTFQNLRYLLRKLHNQLNLRWQIGQLMMMISTTSTTRSGNVEAVRSGKRIGMLKRYRKIGMTSTIQLDQTIMKNTRTVMRKSEKLEIGKMCYMLIDSRGEIAATTTAIGVGGDR
jgi:hypothetical protein